jgi:hypothetical protein
MVNPPKFEMGHLTPLTIQYQLINPLEMIRAVLLGGMADVDGGIAKKVRIETKESISACQRPLLKYKCIA